MYAVIPIIVVVICLVVVILIGERNKRLLENKNVKHEERITDLLKTLIKVRKEYVLFLQKTVDFKNHLRREIHALPDDAKQKLAKVIDEFEKKLKED